MMPCMFRHIASEHRGFKRGFHAVFTWVFGGISTVSKGNSKVVRRRFAVVHVAFRVAFEAIRLLFERFRDVFAGVHDLRGLNESVFELFLLVSEESSSRFTQSSQKFVLPMNPHCGSPLRLPSAPGTDHAPRFDPVVPSETASVSRGEDTDREGAELTSAEWHNM